MVDRNVVQASEDSADEAAAAGVGAAHQVGLFRCFDFIFYSFFLLVDLSFFGDLLYTLYSGVSFLTTL